MSQKFNFQKVPPSPALKKAECYQFLDCRSYCILHGILVYVCLCVCVWVGGGGGGKLILHVLGQSGSALFTVSHV